MENYYEYQLSKVQARMKPDVVPHIFTCQPDKKNSNPRLRSEIRSRKRKISEILNDSEGCLQNSGDTSSEVEQITSLGSIESTEQLTPMLDFSCQANPVKYRSKAVQVSVQTNVAVENIGTSPIKFVVPVTPNRIKQKRVRFDSENSVSSERGGTASIASCSESWHSSEVSSENSDRISDKQNKQLKFRVMFIDILKKKLRMYTGIPKENQKFLNLLETRCSLDLFFIYLTLYKIKTNDSFEKIGDLLGVSKTYASKIFQRSSVILAHFMKKLIFWPSKFSIKKNLPIQFRITFANVQSIIDCLEIEIQKPSSAKQQALTWSDYKKCNTIKYLISSTPDGLINFVSKGYGGRTSDVAIFEDCGFLNELPENSVIMADRGFKKIETFLHKKNCTLIRPPSVANKEKMSKDDVLLTKRIASVRIHIERVIKRIRDFKLLSPHATVNLSLVQKLDHVIIIACAIINLQSPIIKQ